MVQSSIMTCLPLMSNGQQLILDTTDSHSSTTQCFKAGVENIVLRKIWDTQNNLQGHWRSLVMLCYVRTLVVTNSTAEWTTVDGWVVDEPTRLNSPGCLIWQVLNSVQIRWSFQSCGRQTTCLMLAKPRHSVPLRSGDSTAIDISQRMYSGRTGPKECWDV